MKKTNTAVKNNLRVIEGDNSRQSANNNRDLPKLPIMKTIKEMVALTGRPYSYFRNLCIQNEIVYTKAGKKYLINYEKYVDYLNGVGQ